MKKRGSQIDKLDQLKLKIVILYDGIIKKIYMTEPIGFVAANLISVDG